jgi:hypothetical protein
MVRAGNWFLVAAIAAVGLACRLDGGSPTGTRGSGGNAGASGEAGSGGTGLAGSQGGAGTSGVAGASGGGAPAAGPAVARAARRQLSARARAVTRARVGRPPARAARQVLWAAMAATRPPPALAEAAPSARREQAAVQEAAAGRPGKREPGAARTGQARCARRDLAFDHYTFLSVPTGGSGLGAQTGRKPQPGELSLRGFIGSAAADLERAESS